MTQTLLEKSMGGIMLWLRKNLFSSPFTSFVTLISVLLIYLIFSPLMIFVFVDANWNIISDNLHLFLLGSFPENEVWRVLVNLVLLLLMIAVTIGKGKQIKTSRLAMGWLVYFVIAMVVLGGFKGSTILPEVTSDLWGGLLLTVLVTVVGMFVSFPLGILLALGRSSRLPIIRYFCIGFIETMRGVPLITFLFIGQILFPLFLPPQWVIGNLMRVMIAVVLFSAAYMAEYIRGGLQSIPIGQKEAAVALGLNPFQVTFYITLPQALKAVLPAIVGQCIAMFKDTSLVAIVGLIDLTGAGRAATGQPEFIGLEAEVYLTIALIYWIFCFSMSKYSKRIEKKFG